MTPRVRVLVAGCAFVLCAISPPVYAQNVPVWLVAAALSPVVVFFLCVVLGMLKRHLRTGLHHAGLVLVWIVLFVLASSFVENDYVIWTPLVLYALHSAVLLVLVLVELDRRVFGRGDTR